MKALIYMMAFLGAATPLVAPGGCAVAAEGGEVDSVQQPLQEEERALRDFKGLISELERYAADAGGANRRRVVNRMDQMMLRELRAIEGRRPAAAKAPRTDADTQGQPTEAQQDRPARDKKGPGIAEPGRLTGMQSAYRICTRMREPAIAGDARSVATFIQQAREFERLWTAEAQALRNLTPAAR